MTCEDQEQAWMAKLQEAADKWGEMIEADEEVMDEYEDAKDTLTQAYSGYAGGWLGGAWGAAGAGIAALGQILSEGFRHEERLQELAEEQRERDGEYDSLVEEGWDLLDDLCNCLGEG